MVSVTLMFYCCDVLAFTLCLTTTVPEKEEKRNLRMELVKIGQKEDELRRNQTQQQPGKTDAARMRTGWEWDLRVVTRGGLCGECGEEVRVSRASKRPLDSMGYSMGYTRLQTRAAMRVMQCHMHYWESRFKTLYLFQK
jgi:hypothetical protein